MTHPTLMQQQAFELLCHICQQRGWLSPIYEECEFTLAKRLCIQYWKIERKADEAGPAWCVWVHATKGTVRRMPPHSLRPRITAQQGFVLATMELQQLGYDPFVAESYTMEATKWGWLLKEKKDSTLPKQFLWWYTYVHFETGVVHRKEVILRTHPYPYWVCREAQLNKRTNRSAEDSNL